MMNRRTMMTALTGIAATASTRIALAQQAGMSRITAYAFSFPGLAGGDIRLAGFAGHPLLIVNTASLCGFTPQSAGLQELWTEFHGRGLTIIGVPSNDFRRTGAVVGATGSPRPRSTNMALPFRGSRRGGDRQGSECASVLQMGGRGLAKDGSALGTSINT